MSTALAAAPDINLYEWVSGAPVVVVARIDEARGKYAEATALSALRGTLPPDGRVLVDVRRANRDRTSGEMRLELEQGRSYVLLLAPASESGIHVLVRGCEGARPLPAEGASVTVEAVARLVRIQDGDGPFLAWGELGPLLGDENPVLVETALDLFSKFHAASPELLPGLLRLLDHPRPHVRGQSAGLVGAVLARAGSDAPVPEASMALDELVARARRDPSAEVRAAATAAIGRISGPGVEDVLEEIARDDPDQVVRYAATRSLYERTPRRGG